MHNRGYGRKKQRHISKKGAFFSPKCGLQTSSKGPSCISLPHPRLNKIHSLRKKYKFFIKWLFILWQIVCFFSRYKDAGIDHVNVGLLFRFFGLLFREAIPGGFSKRKLFPGDASSVLCNLNTLCFRPCFSPLPSPWQRCYQAPGDPRPEGKFITRKRQFT